MRLRETHPDSGLGLLWFGFACFSSIPAAAQSQPAAQPSRCYAEPVAVCEITDPRLDEASGLAASRRNPGYYYTHNDSQGKPHVYVLDRTGRIHATIRLAGARNVDWEDISLAPGEKPGSYDVCVADIGDNRSRRDEVVIHRFPEPEISDSEHPDTMIDVAPTAYRCKYEDGPKNAEGLAVHPRTGVGYVFSKHYDGDCRVYVLGPSWKTDGINTLQRGRALPFPPGTAPVLTIVTAADISPDGTRLVTRSYVGGWEWRLVEKREGNAIAIVPSDMPMPLTLATEPQGEALCFSADGDALLTISEKTPTMLYESRIIKAKEQNTP